LDARASRSEHRCHGIATDPDSIITISASGVVSIAFANTGLILLSTISSKMLAPCRDDLIEMLKDNLSHLAPQTRRAVVFKILGDIETVRMDPILALGISLGCVDVHWFVALV
jgi:hypothetical protein